MSILFLCTNYIFPGCDGKGTNLVALVDSKIFDRQNKSGCVPGMIHRSSGQPGNRWRALNDPLPGMIRALNDPRPE